MATKPKHLRANSCKWPTWCTILFSCMFIPNLYMFRALMCSSSGELIVSIRHPVYVTLCRWRSGMQVWVELVNRRINCINTTSGICRYVGDSLIFRFGWNWSSGELIVSIRHLVQLTLCGWQSGMQAWVQPKPAHECLKSIEIWNKLIRKKNCVSSWSFARIIPRCTVNKTQNVGAK